MRRSVSQESCGARRNTSDGLRGDATRLLNAPLDQQQIEIIQDNGDRKTPTELSRGTQEQLYLSLRFGLIEEFAHHSRGSR